MLMHYTICASEMQVVHKEDESGSKRLLNPVPFCFLPQSPSTIGISIIIEPVHTCRLKARKRESPHFDSTDKVPLHEIIISLH